MRKNSLLLPGMTVLFALISGCYDYTAPAAATMGESYSARQHDAADEIFKDKKTLTLLEAQQIAIRNSPTYIAAYHSMEAARMKYYQAWGAYSPTISADFSLQNGRSWLMNQHNPTADNTSHPHKDAFTTSFGVTANLLLFDGFARYFRLKAAKSSLSYYERMEEDDCRRMMLAVAYAYNEVLLAIEKRRIAIEDRKFELDSLRDTKYKFEAGAAPLSDVLNFEILVDKAEVNLIAADYSYDVAIYALALLMGLPEGTLPADMQFTSSYKTDFVELPAVEIYLDAALANRPDLKAYREQLNIAKYQVYQAWSAYSPVFNGFVSYGFGTNSTIGADYDGGHDRDYYNDMEFSYGLTASWTLFNGAIRYNQLREAQANRAVAEFEVASQWFTVVSEVRTAYANYVQNVQTTKLYEKIRELSARQRGLVDDEYRVGNAELTRLNEAQRDLVEAETNLASSYINIQNSKALLDSVVGGNSAQYYLDSTGTEKAMPGLGALYSKISGVVSDVDNGETLSPSAPAPAQSAASAPAPAPAESVQVVPPPAPAESVQAAPPPAPAESVQAAPVPAPAESVQVAPPPAPAESVQAAPVPAPAESVQAVSAPAPAESVQVVPPPAPAESVQAVPAPAPAAPKIPESPLAPPASQSVSAAAK